MKNIVIIGSGGFAKEVAFLIEEINAQNPKWNLLGFINAKNEKVNSKYQIYNDDKWLHSTNEKISVVFGIGSPNLIEKIHNELKENKNLDFPNLIHPNVVGDWSSIKIGTGNIICASNTFTTDISIGNFNIFNLDCTLGHDSSIGDYNVINPSSNISGGVKIANKCFLGTNSTILQYVSICSLSVIGASTLVNKSIEREGTYIGIPAKQIK